MAIITLPFAGNAQFCSSELVNYFIEENIRHLLIGARNLNYDDLEHRNSLDRWLRDLPVVPESCRNISQARNVVVRDLCETLEFETIIIENNSPGRNPEYIRCLV